MSLASCNYSRVSAVEGESGEKENRSLAFGPDNFVWRKERERESLFLYLDVGMTL